MIRRVDDVLRVLKKEGDWWEQNRQNRHIRRGHQKFRSESMLENEFKKGKIGGNRQIVRIGRLGRDIYLAWRITMIPSTRFHPCTFYEACLIRLF